MRINFLKKFPLIYLLCSLFLLPAVAVVRYNLSLPLKGDSITTNELQYKISTELFSSASKMYPSCTDFEISDTQMIYYPKDVKKKNGKIIKGHWNELWTLRACDTKIQIPVTFYVNRTKTNYIFEEPLCIDKFPKNENIYKPLPKY